MQTASPALAPVWIGGLARTLGGPQQARCGGPLLCLSRDFPGPVSLRQSVPARPQGPDTPQKEARGPAVATRAKVSSTGPGRDMHTDTWCGPVPHSACLPGLTLGWGAGSVRPPWTSSPGTQQDLGPLSASSGRTCSEHQPAGLSEPGCGSGASPRVPNPTHDLPGTNSGLGCGVPRASSASSRGFPAAPGALPSVHVS